MEVLWVLTLDVVSPLSGSQLSNVVYCFTRARSLRFHCLPSLSLSNEFKLSEEVFGTLKGPNALY